jgi:hypothetical protein
MASRIKKTTPPPNQRTEEMYSIKFKEQGKYGAEKTIDRKNEEVWKSGTTPR